MTVTLNDRNDFTLKALARVALGGEDVRFTKRAEARIARAHAAFQRHVEASRDGFIYGVTSEAGPHAAQHVSPDAVRDRQARGIPFLGLSFGTEDWPDHAARAAVFATLALLIEGSTAAHPARARSVADMLRGRMPKVPAQGLSSPGEMMALFHLFRDIPRDSAHGHQLYLANGAPVSAGLTGLAAIFARRRLALAERVFALSVEAIGAPLEHYDPALKDLWGDPYEARALDNLGALLKGARSRDRRPYQAPVSYRILPRVLGQMHRAVAALEEVAAVLLSATGANPLFAAPNRRSRNGRTLSNGAFHNAAGPHALNAVAAGWVDLAGLAHRHAVKLHKGDVSMLPNRLLPDGVHYMTGRSTTYLEFVPNDMVEEMRRLAQPTLLSPAEPGASEQDDVAAPAFAAARAEGRVAALFDMVLVVAAVSASQALHVTDRAPPPPLRRFLRQVRDVFPPVTVRRALGPDCAKLAAAFRREVEAAP